MTCQITGYDIPESITEREALMVVITLFKEEQSRLAKANDRIARLRHKIIWAPADKAKIEIDQYLEDTLKADDAKVEK